MAFGRVYSKIHLVYMRPEVVFILECLEVPHMYLKFFSNCHPEIRLERIDLNLSLTTESLILADYHYYLVHIIFLSTTWFTTASLTKSVITMLG